MPIGSQGIGNAQTNHASTDDQDVCICFGHVPMLRCLRREHGMSEMGIGILGAGAIAQVHAQGMAEAGVPLVGFCDPDQAKAESAASSFGGEAWADASEMFACDAVKAVVVAVPNQHHASMAIAAMEAGRHVLLEKPMAMNAGECQELSLIHI